MTKEKLLEIANDFIEKYPYNSSQKFQAYLKKNHLDDILQYCLNLSNQYNLKTAAAFYMYLHNMTEPPKCNICHTEIPRFISFNIGFLPKCKQCGTQYSHQVLKDIGKHKSQETIEKLKESNRKTGQLLRQRNLEFKPIDITEDILQKSHLEALLAQEKGYLTHPMDNLKLNKMRSEYPLLMNACKSMLVLKKTKNILEGLYLCLHDIRERPQCQLKLDNKCTNIVTFINLEKGYHKACGQCSKHTPESKQKSILTMKSKYGVDNAAQLKEFMIKRGDNFEKKYGNGIRHHMQTIEGKQKVIDAVLKQTNGKYKYAINIPRNIEKRNNAVSNNQEEIQKKIVEKYREHYGVDRYQSSDEFKERLRNSIINNEDHIKRIEEAIFNLKEYYNIEILETPKLLNQIVPFRCSICGYIGKTSITRIECGNYWVCPVCHPINGKRSKGEIDLENYIKSIIPNIKYETSNRTILDGKEIDLFYPDYNLAIEYCGMLYHSSYICESSVYKNDPVIETYHYDKWIKCKEKGIQLITMFEDDWIIVKYRKIAMPLLLSKFNIYGNTIDIKDCNIDYTTDKDIIYQHLKKTCIDRFNDYDQSFIITYNKEIVSMFVFKEHENYYDIRFCNIKEYNILNGFEVLLNQFKVNHVDKPIRYYVNRNFNDQPDLLKYGFKLYNDQPNLNKFYWGKTLWRRKMINDFNENNQIELKSDNLNYLFDCGTQIYQL